MHRGDGCGCDARTIYSRLTKLACFNDYATEIKFLHLKVTVTLSVEVILGIVVLELLEFTAAGKDVDAQEPFSYYSAGSCSSAVVR